MWNVSIEGNIGVGKSVFLQLLQKVIVEYEEDIAQEGEVTIDSRGAHFTITKLPVFIFLDEVFDPVIVDKFYNEQIRPVDFEKYVISIRRAQMEKAKGEFCDFIISDRCVLSSLPFIHSLYETQQITQKEYDELSAICVGNLPDQIIYVQATTGTMMSNIKTRGVQSEVCNLNDERLERIEKNYRGFIMNLLACNRGHPTKKPCLVMKSFEELNGEYARDFINNFIIQYVLTNKK
jgi:deoxyadenosine/deoxycytidine kinase